MRVSSSPFLLALLAACGTTNPTDSGDPADTGGHTDTSADTGGDTDTADTADTADTGDTADTALVDADGDGLPDADDPTPNGSELNQLNGTFTGGSASVVAIHAYLTLDGTEYPDYVYNDDLSLGCTDTYWAPQHPLCDESPTTDDPDLSTRSNADAGATWRGSADITGVLVIDACADESCVAIDFMEARIFQMFSDGKTTSVRISSHPDFGANAPAWNDTRWTPIGGFEAVGAGTDIDGTGLTVGSPTVLSSDTATLTRYLLIEARNDGSLGSGSYTELRALKLFGAVI